MAGSMVSPGRAGRVVTSDPSRGAGGGRGGVRTRRLLVGLLVSVVFGWLAFTAVARAGGGSRVLVVARPVQRNAVLTVADLRVVSVKAPGVSSIPASESGSVVGRVAAQDLSVGELLAPGELVPGGAVMVGSDEAVVAVVVPVGLLPDGLPVQGSKVVLVERPAGGAGGSTDVSGRVLKVTGGPAGAGSSRDWSVSVVVAVADAPGLSAASAAGLVSLVVAGG